MYRRFSIADFRKNIRLAFNAVDGGETVIIERFGVEYELKVNKKETPWQAIGKNPAITGVAYASPGNLGETEKKRLSPKTVFQVTKITDICKIHGTPLDVRGRCLQKGCKYG